MVFITSVTSIKSKILDELDKGLRLQIVYLNVLDTGMIVQLVHHTFPLSPCSGTVCLQNFPLFCPLYVNREVGVGMFE